MQPIVGKLLASIFQIYILLWAKETSYKDSYHIVYSGEKTPALAFA